MRYILLTFFSSLLLMNLSTHSLFASTSSPAIECFQKYSCHGTLSDNVAGANHVDLGIKAYYKVETPNVVYSQEEVFGTQEGKRLLEKFHEVCNLTRYEKLKTIPGWINKVPHWSGPTPEHPEWKYDQIMHLTVNIGKECKTSVISGGTKRKSGEPCSKNSDCLPRFYCGELNFCILPVLSTKK